MKQFPTCQVNPKRGVYWKRPQIATLALRILCHETITNMLILLVCDHNIVLPQHTTAHLVLNQLKIWSDFSTKDFSSPEGFDPLQYMNTILIFQDCHCFLNSSGGDCDSDVPDEVHLVPVRPALLPLPLRQLHLRAHLHGLPH